MTPASLTVLLFLVSSFPLAAQTPYLVKDINTTFSFTAESSSPRDFLVHRGKTYFVATTAATGTELWSTDGSAGGTSLVADIMPGSGSSHPIALKVFGDRIFFNARDADHGIELWVTDGTASGTRRLTDIHPGQGSSQPGTRVLYKNRMLFSADDGTNGRELWITDGTVEGTRLLKDLNPGSASSSLGHYAVLGDTLYFLAAGGLWKTDGTEAGTVKVATVGARGLRAAGTQLFFEGFDVAGNWELWTSDGSETGTRMVADLIPGAQGALYNDHNLSTVTPIGDRVLFLANDGVHGRELWISDGTAAGTHLVRDLVPGAGGLRHDQLANAATLGDRVYFAAKDNQHGSELWVTDGTEIGTTMFVDLTPGTASSAPHSLTVTGGMLFFAFGSDLPYGRRLGVTDGTIAGTRIVAGATPFGAGSLWTAGDGKVYFEGHAQLTGGEPWVSDGTESGTRMIANLEADGAPSSSPRFLTAAGGLLFFYAIEGLPSPTTQLAPASLWRSDGTAAGTYKLAEAAYMPDALLPCGPFVFFDEQIHRRTFMMSDGTISGTRPANAFLRRFHGERITSCHPLGDELLVVADYGSDETLWKTTSSPLSGALRLGSRGPFGLVDVAGHYVFYAKAWSYPHALWTTDGTPAGTYPLIPELVDPLLPRTIVNAAGTLFFLAGWPGAYTSLYKGDGSLDATAVVKKLPFADASGSAIVAAGRRVFFLPGDSLWTSDGTETGTLELARLKRPPFAYSSLTAVGNRIVFAQSNETAGYDLWTSDGTAAGTKLLR